MKIYWAKLFQTMAMATLLVLAGGCASTTTGESASGPRPAGTITIRESQALRVGMGGTGQGTLIFLGWQHTFEVQNMILSDIGSGEIEFTGEVWNLEEVKDFEGTFHVVKEEFKAQEGLSGLWLENEKGVRVHVRTEGQNLSIRVDAAGAVVTLKD